MKKIFDLLKIKSPSTKNDSKKSESLLEKKMIYNSKENSLYHFSNKFIEKSNQLDYNLFIKCFIHELRTPINTIELGIQVLEQENPKLKDNETIQDIKLSVEFLENVITNFATVQETNIKLNPFVPYSLKCLIQESISMLPQNELRKNVKIDYFIEDSVYDLNYMDVSHLKQVLINILKNAIKYQTITRQNIITIIIKNKNEQNGNVSYRIPSKPTTPRQSFIRHSMSNRIIKRVIEIIITDNNDNIPQHIKEHLFETFNSTSGSGLGLYICKTILELHNGNITHNFIYPNGNKFTIQLELDISKSKQISFENNNKIFNILYFDDNKLNCKLLYKILSNANVFQEIKTVDKNMVSFTDYDKYHIIFIDKFMNEISGCSLSKSIRDKYKNKLIFGLTGNCITNDSFIDNMDYIFVKPFTKEKIIQLKNFINTYGCVRHPTKVIKLIDNNLIWV